MEYVSEILLNVTVYTPFICAVIFAVLWKFIGAKISSMLTVFASIISLLCGLTVCCNFMEQGANMAGFLYSYKVWILPELALSAISMPMLALAVIVGFAATIYSMSLDIKNAKLYYFLLLVMQGGLFGAFTSSNLLWIYMFHEFALVPTFIAMILWGSAGKRIAAMQMAIYLTLGALVSLIGIIAIYARVGASDFSLAAISSALASQPISNAWQESIFAMLLFGLGTLVSLFPFYTWAPRTYACAPTAFAMLHAGVLKKFGLFVLIQVAVPILPYGCYEWSSIIAILALFNVIYIGIVTMAQPDLKLMVSYSSVAHMGLCFLGIATMSVLGVGGALLLMFGHGLSVALMLMLSNIIVNRTNQWSMLKMGGLYKQTPILAGFFIAGTMASLGLPLFANFWGEVTILTSLWNFSPTVCALATTGIIISAIYGLRAVARVFMGEPSDELKSEISSISDISKIERIAAIALVVALVFVGVYPKSITKSADVLLKSFPAYNQGK
ncbi:MAG: NADH-quinone oxidoreductase subunit M [Opitutales bacterium]|nr:NADH-quinone oxidoreductase subunit M [Opitutales bacterium]